MSNNTSENDKRVRAGQWNVAWRRYKKNKVGLFGTGIVALFVFAAIFGPYITSYEARSIDSLFDLEWSQPPSWKHPFGTTIAGYDVFNWMLYFNNDQFYEARVGINVVLDAQALTKYKEVKTLLSKKYGTPDVNVENYSYPYEAGDGHEETAIKLGKANIGAHWKTNKTTISLQILTTLDIMLLYQANELSKEAKKNNENKKLDEF